MPSGSLYEPRCAVGPMHDLEVLRGSILRSQETASMLALPA
jgi:hypothetical protein